MQFNIDPALANNILILLGYGLLGALIKYIDEAFDADAYKKETATILAIPAAAIASALIIYNPPSAAILLAIMLASAAAGKIDNIAFKMMLILTLIATSLYPDTKMPWLAFTTLTLAAIVDHYGNDWSDQRRKAVIPNTRKNSIHDILENILQYRPLLILTAITLTLTSQLPTINLAAMALFDITYYTTNKLTHKPTKKAHKKLQQA